MREQRIDILSERVLSKADAICFCSNGIVRSDNSLVMGAGVAKVFRDRFPGLDVSAGEAVRDNGNICQVVGFCPPRAKIVAFPTKHDWKDPSDLELIKKSARELMELIEKHNWKLVALPFPGIGRGGLDKETVRQALAPILDDRVVIVYR
jgi:hypothetical protein